MPLYDFSCAEAHTFERFVPLADFEKTQNCACGLPAKRRISAPMFTVDETGYTCPITDKWVSSKHQHRENLALHGCRVLETGEAEASTAYRRKEDEKLDKLIDDTVEKQIESMPSDKKEQLHNELVNAKSDISVDRLAV